MIPKDIFTKIRRIEITTKRLATDVFAGAYHSVFKGQGVEFDEVREYQPGDDIRMIDWNVTARTGRPHIKKFIEEREMTVMLVVDASRSCHFATTQELKSKLAAEIAAVLAFSAVKNNDKVGLLIFTEKIEKFIPPRKGLQHVLRVIREVLYFKPQGRGTNINQALEFLSKVARRRSVAFMISDFFDQDIADTLRQGLTIANKRHDVIAITLNDPKEFDLPDCGLLELQDAETGKRFSVDSGDRLVRQRYRENALKRAQLREDLFRSVGVDAVHIFTDKPFAPELVKFFVRRKKRFR
ncbi:MAG TPA: DUF58 domain-containing protein, partial [Candidatus Omnitrophota bacterium]|nr:DUF58 domain-containing protein [Candidatus Omnitrophota bacterium]